MFIWWNFAVVSVKTGEGTFTCAFPCYFLEDELKMVRDAEREMVGDKGI